MAFHNQMKNVFGLSYLPFCRVAYNGGYFKAIELATSSSNIMQKTGNIVKKVEYPSISGPLKTLIDKK